MLTKRNQKKTFVDRKKVINMISVFIPAYNAHNTIDYAVMSLANQTARNLMKVFIINDGSDKNYAEVIEKFSPYINIVEITHEKNMGVGRARQTALDILDTEYFAFLDADDIYIDSTIFEIFYTQMEQNPNYIVFSAEFYEELELGSYLSQKANDVWLFAKIYRSSFIKKNNLSFPLTRCNEDNVFNISLIGCLKGDEVVANYDSPVYLWKYSKNSITRKNNFQHWFAEDLKGLVEGLYYIKDNPNINKIHWYRQIKLTFFHLYFRYHDNLVHLSEKNFAEDMLILAKKIYYDFLKDYDLWLEEENIKTVFKIVALDFHKPYEDVKMFRDFLEMVK